MRRRLLILSASSLLSILFGVLPCRGDEPGDAKWGPFRGRIVDTDTGEPIPGAVALAIWLEIIPTPVQTNHKFYDVRLAVTGADGVFEISRREPPFFSSRIEKPLFHYFAPGYALIGFKTTADGLEVTQMRKQTALSLEERLRTAGIGRAVWVPEEKRIELIESINVERQRMGLRPIRLLGGEP